LKEVAHLFWKKYSPKRRNASSENNKKKNVEFLQEEGGSEERYGLLRSRKAT